MTFICTKCVEDLPLTPQFFHKQKSTKTGFKYICRHCCSIKDNNIYVNKRELYIKRAQNRQKRLKLDKVT